MPDLVSLEPATGAEVWRGETGDVDAEVAAAREGWAAWAARPVTYRIETLRRFANTVRARHEVLAFLLAREVGKPLWEARTEVDGVIAAIDGAVGAYAERTAQRRLDAPMGTRTALRHKPHGVLAVITPFCNPALIPAGHLLPALVAGNAVVLKPSPHAPATAEMLVDCLLTAGVPDACMRLVHGGAAEGKALAGHRGIDGVLFTGSARTGVSLHRQFADRPNKLLSLEMGGNNALVVWDTPDLHAAALIVLQSAYANAGQICTAARRLIVVEDAAAPLIAELGKLLARVIVGAPGDDPQPYLGPVISNDAADLITENFLALLMRGGRPIRHLERPVPGRPFLLPALIDVTAVADRPDEELFGPVLQIVRVPDFDAAIAEANNTRFGLSASLLSQTPALYDRFWAGSRAGMVNWNRPTHAPAARAPLGGQGWSGNHRPGGWYAADQCAYPVVSNEADAARASVGIGLREG